MDAALDGGTTNGVASRDRQFPHLPARRARRGRGSASAVPPTRGACGSRTIPARRHGPGSSTRSPARDTNGWNSARTATCRPTPGRCAASSRPAACAAGGTVERCATPARGAARHPGPDAGGRAAGERAGRRARGVPAGDVPRPVRRPPARTGRTRRGPVGRADRRRRPPRPRAARGDRDAARVPPARGEPRRDRRADPPLPGRHRSRNGWACAWTPGMSPTPTGTRRGSSASTPSASGTSTSRPSIPACSRRSEAERLSFADAVQRDVMCEPGLGVPALDDLTAALGVAADRHVRDRRAGPVPVRFRPPLSHRRAHAQDPPSRRNRVNPMSKHVTVAVVGAGMAGQAHAFGYRNATMHPDLAGVGRPPGCRRRLQRRPRPLGRQTGTASPPRPPTWTPCSATTASTRSASRCRTSPTPT